MFIEIHLLQNFAPSNLNRDDTGNPKDTEFGGVRRARISSQCIKRAIRTEPSFARYTEVPISERTRWLTRILARRLTEAGKPQDQAWSVAEAFANALGVGTDKDKQTGAIRTKVLFFISQAEQQAIAEKILAQWDEVIASLDKGKSTVLDSVAKEFVKTFKNRAGAPDIALFGRMLAENPDLSLDAASQVAHAISTHRVSMDLDFYTAVDELSQDDETGAGMMGVTGYNSACFYRYARIDWEQLLQNLDGNQELARRTVRGFLHAALRAVPTGKQNSFAAQNPPDFVLGVVRQDGESWSLANAFEKPVKAGKDGGYLVPSIAALDAYWARLEEAYGDGNLHRAVLNLAEEASFPNLKSDQVKNREQWVAKLISALPGE